MHDLIGLVAVVMGILWVSGTLNTLAKKIPSTGHKELLEEIRKLREEMQALRRENHDLILSFDATLRHSERRLDHLETAATRPAASSGADIEPQRLTLGR